MKKVAIILCGSGARSASMVEYLKSKLSTVGTEIEVIEAEQMVESGRKLDVLHVDDYLIEDLSIVRKYNPLKEHRGKHRTHNKKHRR